jgi:CubicO group peptidase (beta-lactamase class C family)
MRHLVYFLMLCCLLSSCIKDGNIKPAAVADAPAFLHDGWDIEPVSGSHVDLDKWQKVRTAVYSETENIFVTGVVVVKNGRLISEMYPKDPKHRDEARQVWSVTKSMVSLLAGIAIDKQLIRSVNDSVFRYLPEYSGRVASQAYLGLTLEQCLTMRSGIDYNNDGPQEEDLLNQVPADLTEYILAQAPASEPGKEAVYKNSDPQLMVKIISNAAGEDLVSFADKYLFGPLGISNYQWSRNGDNTPYGGFGLWLRPRDLAKIGQLVLDTGTWKQSRIVSWNWIRSATSPKTPLDGYDYGYYFWIDASQNTCWLWGHGGQYVFIVPSKKLVIVITSDPFAEKGTGINEARTLVDQITDAVK